MGTENVLTGSAQIALRLNHTDAMAGAKSFMTGASVHNVVSKKKVVLAIEKKNILIENRELVVFLPEIENGMVD